MSTVTETWPTTHPPSDVSINGDQTWTLVTNPGVGWAVSSGAAIQIGDDTTTTRARARCNAALATADHEAQIAIGPISSDNSGAMQVGPAVRFDPSTNACYYAIADLVNNDIQILKADSSGGLTTLSSVSFTCALNDVVKLRATGSTTVSLTLFVNGTSQLTASDSTSPLSNLRAGIGVITGRFNDTTPLGVHSFTATDVSTGTNYTLSVATMTINVVLDTVTLTYTPASGSGAYLFGTGVTDNIDMGTSVTHAATYSAAIRFALTTSSTETRMLVCFHDGTTTDQFSILCFGGTDELHVSQTEASGATTHSATWTTGGLTAGTTHVVVATRNDSTGDLIIYGDTDATPKQTTASTPTPDQGGTQHFMVGNQPSGTISAHAKIFEVAYWAGTVLTPAQAAALGTGGQMAFGFPQPTDYYNFSGNANDLFGGKNGTVTGATQVADPATSWFPVAAGTLLSTVGRGAWRGAFRGSNRGAG